MQEKERTAAAQAGLAARGEGASCTTPKDRQHKTCCRTRSASSTHTDCEHFSERVILMSSHPDTQVAPRGGRSASRSAGARADEADKAVWTPEEEGLDWTTQAIGQQHTSPLRAGCEARRREIVVIFVVVVA